MLFLIIILNVKHKFTKLTFKIFKVLDLFTFSWCVRISML